MKKQLSVLLCTCLIASPFASAAPVNAESPVPEFKTTALKEPDTARLSDITVSVKSKISIPKSLTEFSYSYNSGSSTSVPNWELVWRNDSDRISVTCDDNKNILQYRYYKNGKETTYKPVFLKSELKPKAEAFIKKVVPDIDGNLKYMESGSADIYSATYTYEYIRVENKIPMPDNTLSVSVNYETGQVMSLSTNWLRGAKIPAPDTAVTKADAAKKIASELKMQLSYRAPFTDDNASTKNQAFLVYEPDIDYVSIDAKTGKVYLTREEYQSDPSYKNESSADAGASRGGSLTEKEIASIEKLNHLISQEKAIQAVKNEKNLLLDEACTSITADLALLYNRYGTEQKEYQWNIRFSDSRNPDTKSDSYTPYATASVDAKTGKILSFYANTPNYYNVSEEKWNEIKVKYSSKECVPIFEEFVKQQIPEYFKNSKLTDTSNDYIAVYKNDQPVYGGYNYQYSRVNESVLYHGNGFSGSVDGVTGKIYNYHVSWDDTLTFQSTKGILTPSEAFNHYIANDGFDLMYEINTIRSTTDGSIKNEVRLVYSPAITPDTISPVTGKQLDYSGKVYVKDTGAYSYSDIASSKNKRAILLLADLGIGFSGGKYQPSKKMTASELDTMLKHLMFSQTESSTKESAKTMTRMGAIKRLLFLTGYDSIAKLNKIYVADFKDSKKIAASDRGYAALAKGMGIVTGTELRPSEALTRGDAAQMIVNLLNFK